MYFGLLPNATCLSFIRVAFMLCIFIQTHFTSPSPYLIGAEMVQTNPQNSRAPQALPGSFHSLQRGVFNVSIRSLVLSVAELQCIGLDRTGKHPYCQWGWGPAALRDKTHTKGRRNKERRGGRGPEEEHNKGRTEEKMGRWGKIWRPYGGWTRSQVAFFSLHLLFHPSLFCSEPSKIWKEKLYIFYPVLWCKIFIEISFSWFITLDLIWN